MRIMAACGFGGTQKNFRDRGWSAGAVSRRGRLPPAAASDQQSERSLPVTDAGARLYISFLESRLGLIGIASSKSGIVRLTFPLRSEGSFERTLLREFHGPRLVEGRRENSEAARQLSRYLAGRLRKFELPLDLRGSSFRRRVLTAVGRIPYGRTASYGDIARLVGSPGGARAVGQAVGANPLPLIIPCHRVVGSNGALVGFGLGLPMKRRLLELERSAG
jgi:methylated-DNA-[protein]-cysteine S-methyltransferase